MDIDTSQEFSEPETQFVPQEGDEEKLWEVIEITAEKGRQYKVKWKGLDPSTGKPWPQSWVLKHDCTPDLVEAWKRKRRRKSTASKKSTSKGLSSKDTTLSPTKSLVNVASTSASTSRTRKPKHRSASTSASVTTARQTKPSPVIPDPEWDSPPKPKIQAIVELQESPRKRKRSIARPESDYDVSNSDADLPEHDSDYGIVEVERMTKSKSKSRSDTRDAHSPAKKKRKVEGNQAPNGAANGVSAQARKMMSDWFQSDADEDGDGDGDEQADRKAQPKARDALAGTSTKLTAKKTATAALAQPSGKNHVSASAKTNGNGKGKGKEKGKEKAKAFVHSEAEEVEDGDEDIDDEDEPHKEVGGAGNRVHRSSGSGASVKDKGKGKGSSVQAKTKPSFVPSVEPSADEDEIEDSERKLVEEELGHTEIPNTESRVVETRESVNTGGGVEEEDNDDDDKGGKKKEGIRRPSKKSDEEQRSRGSSDSSSKKPTTKTARRKKVAASHALPAPASVDEGEDEDGPVDTTASISDPAPKPNQKSVPSMKVPESRKTAAPVIKKPHGQKLTSSKSNSATSLIPDSRDAQPASSRSVSRATLPRNEPNENGRSDESTLNPNSALTGVLSKSTVNEAAPVNANANAGDGPFVSNSNVAPTKHNSVSGTSRGVRSKSPQPGSSSTTRASSKVAPVVQPQKEAAAASRWVSNSLHISPEDESLRLSPGARARLKEFDDFLASLPPDEEPQKAVEPEQQQQQQQLDIDDSIDLQYPDIEPSLSQSQIGDTNPSFKPQPQPAQHSQGSESFVPETELSNNTQQSLPSPPEPGPKDGLEDEPQSDDERITPPPPPPQRSPSSLVAKMKPRTPSKRVLRPIPVITPSRFASHLFQAKLAVGVDSGVQGDSIEQWSSPEKTTAAVRGSEVPGNPKSTAPTVDWTTLNPSQDSEALEVEIRQRGLEMAQEAKRKRLERENGGIVTKRRTLDEIIANGKGKQIFAPPPMSAPRPETEPAEAPIADVSMDLNDSTNVVESSIPSLEYPPDVPMDVSSTNKPSEQRSLSKSPADAIKEMPPSRTARKSATPSSISPAVPADPRSRAAQVELDEKISKLENTVTTQRAENDTLALKNDALLREISSLKEALAAAAASIDSVTQTRQEAEQKVEALTQSLTKAVAVKDAAESDKEFVREQYSKASAFAATTRAENEQLEKRAQIAESQAKEGVAMIKATYERRIKELEDDANLWKQMGNWAMKKDIETNDEIRRRAAEEPELRRENDKLRRTVKDLTAQVKELKEEIEPLHEEIQVLEAEVQKEEDQRSAAAAQVEHWKAHVARLTVELNEKQSLSTTSFSSGDLVYRCHYRQTDDSPSCVFVCRTPKELENHVIQHTEFE